jgi:hypothetical protein
MVTSRRSRRASGGSQTEKPNHWFDIAIVVQQQVATLDAEGPDDKIDRLADRAAPAAEKAVVRRRLNRQVGVEQRHSLKSPQAALDEASFSLGPQSLQDFAQDQIADQQRYGWYQRAEPADRTGHVSFSVKPRYRRITALRDPADFRPVTLPMDLSCEVRDLFLFLDADQHSQRGLGRCPLGLEAREAPSA